jgi:GNAT superfamily N-acetyltransferase
MAPVLQMSKTLETKPDVPDHEDIHVRNFAGPQDIDIWLHIRQLAFATEDPGARPWSTLDFAAEISGKSWWSAERMWLAFGSQDAKPLGAVICAVRGRPPQEVPVVHWLAVVPSARRTGLGRLLMAHLESYCWRKGFRALHLETHANWTAAVQLYESLGFRQASTIPDPCGPSPLTDATQSH